MKLNIYLACGHAAEGTKAEGRRIAEAQSEGRETRASCPEGCGMQVVKAKKAQRATPAPRPRQRR